MQSNTDRRLVWAVQLMLRVLVVCTLFQSFSLSAQCTLSCPSGLNLSIAGPDYGCTSVLTPIDIGVIAPSCTGLIDLDLYTTSNQLLPGDTTLSGARTGLVTSAQIGMQLRARVTHRATGNNCDINLTIVDGLSPVLTLADTTVSILQDLLPMGFGGSFEGPFIEDCTSTTQFYTDSVSQASCDSSAYAKTYRQWTVTDAYGNSTTANQIISQVAVQLDSIRAPNDTIISCVGGVPLGISMGVPSVHHGGAIYELSGLSGSQDNLFWSYTDESFAGGGGTAQLLRSFRFYDACSPAVAGQNPRDLVQIISVVDTVAPVITTLIDTLYYSTSTSNCEASINLPALSISDDCTSVPINKVQLDGQFISSNGGFFGLLALGTYTAVYTTKDSSNNASSRSIVLVVRDVNPPVLITKNTLQVSLSSSGQANVSPILFDQGSYDDCTDIDWTIRLVGDTNWLTNLGFNCQTLEQEQNVEVRACDQYGNCNIRQLIVNTFDYLPPVVTAPPDLTFACSVSDTSYSLFGAVMISDNCSFVATDSMVIDRDQCGVGEIRRFWEAVDSSGNSSTGNQVISFVPAYSFSESDIVWPRDTFLSMCHSLDTNSLPEGVGAPDWATIPCSDIAVGYEDQRIAGPSGVCKVLFRTWTVIDQCSFDGVSTGIWEHVQQLQLIDLDPPLITSSSDTIELYTSVNTCDGSYLPSNLFSVQDCSVFSSELKFYNGLNLSHVVTYVDTNIFVQDNIDRVEFLSMDDCGNTDSLSVAVHVIDGSPPIAICVDTLTYYIQSDSAGFDVSLLDINSQDACGKGLENVSSSFIPSCETLGWNRAELVVIDSVGLLDACFTEVNVMDTSRICPLKSTTVYGKIATVNNHAIPTRFDLIGTLGDTVGTFLSELDGSFSFGVELLDSVTVIPSSTYAPPMFLSTYDLYLIGQHILGITEFSDPLKRFAGDGNRSRTVTAYDMTLFRRLFLELTDALPHGNSMRFIPDTADLTLPDVQLTPGIPMLTAVQDSTYLSWHAIKLGDVSGTRSLRSVTLEARTLNRLPLIWRQSEASVWRLEYHGERDINLYGLGLWLSSESAKMDGALEEGAVIAHQAGGTIISWLSGAVPLTLKQGVSLLTVESKERPRLDLLKSDAVVSTSDMVDPEEYRISTLDDSAESLAEEPIHVYPNPAIAGTMLRVHSENSMISSLHIVDARGIVIELSVESGPYATGLLPSTLASGIYALQGRYRDGRTFEQRILVSK